MRDKDLSIIINKIMIIGVFSIILNILNHFKKNRVKGGIPLKLSISKILKNKNLKFFILLKFI